MQESLAALTRRLLEEQKKAAAANKEKAVAAAVEAADAAAAGGRKFLVARLEVGLDAKAIQVGAGCLPACLPNALRALHACMHTALGFSEMACRGLREQHPACLACPCLP